MVSLFLTLQIFIFLYIRFLLLLFLSLREYAVRTSQRSSHLRLSIICEPMAPSTPPPLSSCVHQVYVLVFFVEGMSTRTSAFPYSSPYIDDLCTERGSEPLGEPRRGWL